VFSTVAIESGTLVFSWTGDNGFSATESAAIIVGGPEMAPHTSQRSEPSRETRDGPR
jgi:hypothetical protein